MVIVSIGYALRRRGSGLNGQVSGDYLFSCRHGFKGIRNLLLLNVVGNCGKVTGE